MSLQDTIRNVLLSYGQAEVPITIDDLVGKTGLSSSQIYQTLYRLEQIGEIEILKEEGISRPKIIGVRLRKMESAEKITERILEQEAEKSTSQEINQTSANVPNTVEYINKRIAIERAREEVAKAHIDPDEVISFMPEPLGEEAIYLLKELTNVLKENKMLSYDLAAEKRNVEYLQKQLVAVRTFDDSGT